MILTIDDYKEIAAKISEGRNHVEYEKDGEMLSLDCTYESEGYREDDYYNGTGAYCETQRDIYIEEAECYDSDGNESVCDVDEKQLLKLIA